MSHLNHVSILVPSVEKTAKTLEDKGYDIGPVDTFEGEGTKEIYINYGNAGSLLLMEAIGPGPYQRALEKRGPGLHHLAIDVEKIVKALEGLTKAGWELHPESFVTMERSKTAYLFRRGFPALIEVQERKPKDEPLFITKLELRYEKAMSRLVSAAGLEGIVAPTAGEPALWIGEARHALTQLCS